MLGQKVLREAEAAQYLAVSLSFLRQARSKSRPTSVGPKFVKIGRAVRYLRSDLDEFLASNRVPGKAA